MSTRLNEVVGTFGHDELIIGNFPVTDVAMIKLSAGKGLVKRGTVVSGIPGGEFAPISEAVTSDVALYIVTDDTDTGETTASEGEGNELQDSSEEPETTEGVMATAYKSGKFNRRKLYTDGTYELSAGDEEFLRLANILLDEAV